MPDATAPAITIPALPSPANALPPTPPNAGTTLYPSSNSSEPTQSAPTNAITAGLTALNQLLRTLGSLAQSGNLALVTLVLTFGLLVYGVVFQIPKTQKEGIDSFGNELRNTIETQREMDRQESREQHEKDRKTETAREHQRSERDAKLTDFMGKLDATLNRLDAKRP